MPTPTPSIETRDSWIVAGVALLAITMTFGSGWMIAVALKDIAAELDGKRSIPALASALVWLGSGVGGIMMGYLADRFGARWTVIGGALMIAIGLSISTLGPGWPLLIGHGLFIGLLGLAGINAPMYVYVSRWFDRRRGSALALISSGSYLAGTLWPLIFAEAMTRVGWRETMLMYALLEAAVVVPFAAVFLRTPPEPAWLAAAAAPDGKPQVLGWPPNLVFALMCVAIALCCVPMAMPQGHLIAFCNDLGISQTLSTAMLSTLLAAAFVSRQIWGYVADRFGGLATVLAGSACQCLAMLAFLFTQNEVGLFTVSAAFGLGFSGIIPAYVLSARELFAAAEAFWRIPVLLLSSSVGMAGGGWIAGALYDHFGFYAPAFACGVAANILNLLIIGTLVLQQGRSGGIGRDAVAFR
jgi:MFS family permease